MTPLTGTLDREVMAAQAGAVPADKTYVSTRVILDYVHEHPGEFPELARRSDKSAKTEMTHSLIRMGFQPYNSRRHNQSGNRVFARPDQLRIATPQDTPQLSAAGGAP